MNIFYYSKFCLMCTDLLKLMDKYKILNRFLLKCIDDMQRIPAQLERVPTLIIVGINKPLVGKEALEWFNNMRPLFLQQYTERQIKNNIQSLHALHGPKGYLDNEYNGISDSFAYTEVDIAQPKTYSQYDNNTVIYTPPDENSIIKKDEQERNAIELDKMRKKQDEEYALIMKREQVETVIRKEREKLIRDNLGI